MQGGTNERDGSQGVKGEVWCARNLLSPHIAFTFRILISMFELARISGVLYHIGQTEFVREVSQASNDSFVVVHLFHNRYAVLGLLGTSVANRARAFKSHPLKFRLARRTLQRPRVPADQRCARASCVKAARSQIRQDYRLRGDQKLARAELPRHSRL